MTTIKSFTKKREEYVIAFLNKPKGPLKFYSINKNDFESYEAHRHERQYFSNPEIYIDDNKSSFIKLDVKFEGNKAIFKYVQNYAIIMIEKENNTVISQNFICDNAVEELDHGISYSDSDILKDIHMEFDSTLMAVSRMKYATFGDDRWWELWNNVGAENKFVYELYYLSFNEAQRFSRLQTISPETYRNYFSTKTPFVIDFDKDNDDTYLQKIIFRCSEQLHMDHYLVLVSHFNQRNVDEYYISAKVEVTSEDNYIQQESFIKYDGVKLYYSDQLINNWPKYNDGRAFQMNIIFLDEDISREEGRLFDKVDDVPIYADVNEYKKYQSDKSLFIAPNFSKSAFENNDSIVFPYSKYEKMKIFFSFESRIATPGIEVDIKSIRQLYHFYDLTVSNNYNFKPLLPYIEEINRISYNSVTPTNLVYRDVERKLFINRQEANYKLKNLVFTSLSANTANQDYFIPFIPFNKKDVQVSRIKSEYDDNRIICPCCGQSIVPYKATAKDKIQANPFRFKFATDDIVKLDENVSDNLMCSNAYCNQLFTYDENLIDGSMRVTVKFIKPYVKKHEDLVKMLDPFIHTKTPFVKDYNTHYRVWQKYNVHNAHKDFYYVNYLNSSNEELTDKEFQNLKFSNAFVIYIFAPDMNEFVRIANSVMSSINRKYSNNGKINVFYDYLTKINITLCYVINTNTQDRQSKELLEIDDNIGINYSLAEINAIDSDILGNQSHEYTVGDFAYKQFSIRNDIFKKYINSGSNYRSIGNAERYNALANYAASRPIYRDLVDNAFSYLNYNFTFARYNSDERYIKGKSTDASHIFDSLLYMHKK